MSKAKARQKRQYELFANGPLCPETDRTTLIAWAKFGWPALELLATHGEAIKRAQSPIEGIFIDYLFVAATEQKIIVDIGLGTEFTEKPEEVAKYKKPTLNLNPQFEFNFAKKYRVDFLIVARKKTKPVELIKVVIECDGHDFHKTKEQRGADASRDRDLALNGFTVFRFTGTELHAKPLACAKQVIAFFKKEGM